LTETKTQLIPISLSTLKSSAFELSVVGADGARGKSERFVERTLIIGASPEAGLTLSDSSVSRRHASISADEHGHKITDLDSKNGLWVNDLRVKEAYLSHGALIRLGGAQLSYQLLKDQPVEHQMTTSRSFGALLGSSELMRSLFAQLERVAQSDVTLLIEGESGTGKELAAEAVHQRSERAEGPFVVFDCSAVSSSLIESELFGHKQGAFTGAASDRAGALRRAEGGTLFLDEIGELPLALQPRLLRALEKREIKAVGADEYRPFSARVIAATNRDLLEEVERGQFRRDLYYRLAVIKVQLPPLRAHPEDIPLLVRAFLDELSPLERREVSYEAMLKMQRQAWRGNVRELKNFVARALTLSTSSGAQLETRLLTPQPPQEAQAELGDEAQLSDWIDSGLPYKDAKARLVERFERLYWERLLKAHSGNISAAAREAGIHRKSAEYLLKKLELR